MRGRRFSSYASLVDNKRELIRHARVFKHLTDEECDVVASACKQVTAAPNAVLFREGDPGTFLLIVVTGTLTVSVKTPSGTQEVIRTVGPGDVIGELAFFDSKPRSATLTATKEGATFISFTRDAMRRIRRDSVRVTAAIHRGILKDLAHRLRDLAVKSTLGAHPPDVPLEKSATLGPGASTTALELSKQPGLARYTSDDFALLAQICTVRSLATGDKLMEQGKRGTACWLLLTGELEARDAKGTTPLATLPPGALVGQLALVDGTVRASTVTARVPSTVLEIRPPAFTKILGGDSPLSLRLQEQVALAGVTQARAQTDRYAAMAGGEPPPKSARTAEWDATGLDGVEIDMDLGRIPNDR